MSKYSSEFKAQIVSDHLKGKSSTELANYYHVPRRRIDKWIQSFRLNGPEALKRRRHK